MIIAAERNAQWKNSPEIMKNQAVALRCSVMVKDVLENFAKFTRLCQSLVFG